jgi:integrase/recombinase XerD
LVKGLPASPHLPVRHHPWPGQPDHERSHSGRYGAPADDEGTANYLAFPSARGGRLSRNGVDHILKQAVARAKCPTLCHKRIHPHAVRHTTGAHLLQSGVDISVIALWLGHESIETTHIYVEADLAAKERALQHLTPIGGKGARARPPDRVLAFLQTL